MASSTVDPTSPVEIDTAENAYTFTAESILGVAVFDIHGLPQEYFITPEHRDVAWVQWVFQSLGLEALLSSTLALSNFTYTIVQTKVGDAVVMRSPDGYLAWLIKRGRQPTTTLINETWIHQACDFEANTLRSHPHFRAA